MLVYPMSNSEVRQTRRGGRFAMLLSAVLFLMLAAVAMA